MGRKISQFKEILKVLEKLHADYPSYSIGRHIATAFADYGDVWGISDKEFLYALEKYQAQLDLGFVPESDESITDIIEDAKNNLFNLDEPEDDY